MEKVLFAFLFLFWSLCAHADPISGTIYKNHRGYFIYLDSDLKTYPITYIDKEAKEAFSKLNTGDYFIGNGTIVDNRNLHIESLDYVGLKKLIGIWYSQQSIINFKTFKELSIYNLGTPTRITGIEDIQSKTNLRYSTAPYDQKQWALFISNRHTTVFATMELDRNSTKATLRLYDGQTGQISSTVILQRWGK